MLVGYSDRMQKIVNNYHDFLVLKTVHRITPTIELFYLKIGDRIHIKSKRGVYVILVKCKNSLRITCNKWQEEFKRGDRKCDYEYISNSDFQCKYGEGKFKILGIK